MTDYTLLQILEMCNVRPTHWKSPTGGVVTAIWLSKHPERNSDYSIPCLIVHDLITEIGVRK